MEYGSGYLFTSVISGQGEMYVACRKRHCRALTLIVEVFKLRPLYERVGNDEPEDTEILSTPLPPPFFSSSFLLPPPAYKIFYISGSFNTEVWSQKGSPQLSVQLTLLQHNVCSCGSVLGKSQLAVGGMSDAGSDEREYPD